MFGSSTEVWLLGGILFLLAWIGMTLHDIRRHLLRVLYDREGYLKARYRAE
jgi:hypothetical protein